MNEALLQQEKRETERLSGNLARLAGRNGEWLFSDDVRAICPTCAGQGWYYEDRGPRGQTAVVQVPCPKWVPSVSRFVWEKAVEPYVDAGWVMQSPQGGLPWRFSFTHRGKPCDGQALSPLLAILRAAEKLGNYLQEELR